MFLNANRHSGLFLGTLLAATAIYVPSARADGHLAVYCSVSDELCAAQVKVFAAKYNVDVSFVRNSSGQMLTKIDAEKDHVQADVWYGGTLDMHLQAGEKGLLQLYSSPELIGTMPRLKESSFSSPIYVGILGFGVNTERLDAKKLPAPACWSDLIKPEYKNEIQMGNPQSSGTAYTIIATLVQMQGEEKAFAYLHQLNANISAFTKAGSISVSNVSHGDAAIGIGFLHDYAAMKEKGFPITTVIPCEGTGFEIGAVSILKGSQNLENAKLFCRLGALRRGTRGDLEGRKIVPDFD